MFCKNCGKEVPDGSAFCDACGASFNNVQSMNQGGYNMQGNTNDNGGFGWGLLGCCIPIVGLILWLVWKNEKPRTAKAAGTGALISVILCVIFYIIYFVFLAAVIGSAM